MIKRFFFCFLLLTILIMLSGCPDKDKSKSEDTEQIPNTMEKAASELEQIITLLGGPMFDGRDKLEQLKNEQIQLLAAKVGENPQQSTAGSDKTIQSQESGGSEKDGQVKDTSKAEQEKGSEQKQEGGDQQKKEPGDSGGKKSGSGQSNGEGEQKPTEGAQKVSSEMTQPSGTTEKPFQFEDSLFGIPQWNEENWKMIKVLSDGMYFTWNDLQPELLKKGISETQAESFGTSLENLSKAVKDKKIGDAQTSAFELYDKLSEFFSYFKTEKPPELQRVSSMVTGIHFAVRQNDWKKAQELSNQLEQEFTKVKTSVKDNQSDAIKMLEISLDDLRSAVQKQDGILVLIRTNLVTANIEELNTGLSQNKKE